jgi:hypothetical protein
MKKSVLFLIIVLLTVSLGGSATAQGTTYVPPYADGETITVPPGDDIILDWSWLATTSGLITAFRTSWSAGYTIKDQNGHVVMALSPVAADAFWSAAGSLPPAAIGLNCPMPQIWWAWWDKEVDLQPGTYTLETQWTQRHPVNDGLHTCTIAATGEPLTQPPSLYGSASGVWTVTIVVQ